MGDPSVRARGASGGVTTAVLLHLLQSGRIDAAIVARQGVPAPLEASPVIASTAEEILDAQGPASGWRTESPSFRPTAGVDGMPRWADYDDPLEAISAFTMKHPPVQMRDEEARQRLAAELDPGHGG